MNCDEEACSAGAFQSSCIIRDHYFPKMGSLMRIVQEELSVQISLVDLPCYEASHLVLNSHVVSHCSALYQKIDATVCGMSHLDVSAKEIEQT